MPAALIPHPALSPPVVLGSYVQSAATAPKAFFQTNAASSSKLSHAAVGEVVKISSTGLRRARGIIATVAAGHAVTLSDAATHAPVQSFVLSHAVQPCTPPLVTLQSASKGNSIRRTYLGVAAQTGIGSEVWMWTESIKESLSASIDANPHRTTVRIKEALVSLHLLASGEVLLRLASGSYSILTPSPAEVEPGLLQLTELAPQSNGTAPSSSSSPSRQITHSFTVLDRLASSQIFGGKFSSEEALASVISITSASRPVELSTSASTPADSLVAPKDKKGRRRKTAIEVIDDVDGSSSVRNGLTAFGPLQVHVQLIGASASSERLRSLGAVPVPGLADSSAVLDVDLYHDGHLSMLTRSGDLYFSNLTVDALEGPQVSHPRIHTLKHIAQDPAPSSPAAVLRLSASHILVVLRASSGPSSGRLVALIWDTDLDALMVTLDWSASWAVGLEESDRRSSLTITRVGGSQVVVEGCSWGKDSASANGDALATLWALPFTIPASSVLRHAVGKAALTNLWSVQLQSENTSSGKQVGVDVQDHQRTLLQRLQSISGSVALNTVERKASEMDTAFASWLSEEGARNKAAWEKQRMASQAAEADLAADASGSDGSDREAVEEAAEDDRREAVQFKSKQQRENKAPKVKLPYAFVVALLDLALPATPTATGSLLYAKKIVSYLLSRKAVSSGMLSGSSPTLMGRLRARGDWPQILTTIRNVSDVTEGELVDLLVELLKSERSNSGEGKATDKIPLDIFLSQFVTMAVSRPLLRSTLHSHVSDSKDVVTLLQIITGWLEERSKQSLELVSLVGPQTDATTSVGPSSAEAGVPAAAAAAASSSRKAHAASRRKRLGDRGSQAKAPPTTDLLQFATDLIDVYFPLLLNTPSTHRTLQFLSKALAAHLSLCSSLATLRGPLDAFTRLDSDRRRLHEESIRRGALQRARDPRVAKQMKVTAGAAGAAVQARSETGGGLTLEGSGTSVRLHALQSSALVGPYTVESIEV